MDKNLDLTSLECSELIGIIQNDKNIDIQIEVVKELISRGDQSLGEASVKALVEVLGDEKRDDSLRCRIAEFLSKKNDIFEEITPVLFKAMFGETIFLRTFATSVLKSKIIYIFRAVSKTSPEEITNQLFSTQQEAENYSHSFYNHQIDIYAVPQIPYVKEKGLRWAPMRKIN